VPPGQLGSQLLGIYVLRADNGGIKLAERTEQVNATPTKRFFVDIVTRDISISAAILDLVDNSIDSALAMRPDGDFTGITVDIVASASEFSIEDSCAGIGVDKAKEYVFRMGRPEDVESAPGSIGQFGVGMKRALFKLGSSFIVNSTTDVDDFTIEIDADRWFSAAEWSFPMTVHDFVEPDHTGTTIIVSDLHPSVIKAFENPEFQSGLRDELRSRHRLAIGNGLQITLNTLPIEPAGSTVAASELIKPSMRSFTITAPDGGLLQVTIVAGVAANAVAGVDEDGEPESQTRVAADAGWLVFGNGRLLLANDTSSLTGWGSGKKKIPQYHNQYSRFRGFVYMHSVDANAIPWNTMKTSVDPDSPIWKQVLEQMIGAARPIIDLLNYAKIERQLATADMATPIIDALSSATPINAMSMVESSFSMSITTLREDFEVDAVYPAPNPELVGAWKKIQYSVDAQSFEDVSAAVGKNSAAEIGRMSFDAFYEVTVEV